MIQDLLHVCGRREEGKSLQKVRAHITFFFASEKRVVKLYKLTRNILVIIGHLTNSFFKLQKQ